MLCWNILVLIEVLPMSNLVFHFPNITWKYCNFKKTFEFEWFVVVVMAQIIKLLNKWSVKDCLEIFKKKILTAQSHVMRKHLENVAINCNIPLRQLNNQNKNLGKETWCGSTRRSFPMFQPMCEEYFWN